MASTFGLDSTFFVVGFLVTICLENRSVNLERFSRGTSSISAQSGFSTAVSVCGITILVQ